MIRINISLQDYSRQGVFSKYIQSDGEAIKLTWNIKTRKN